VENIQSIQQLKYRVKKSPTHTIDKNRCGAREFLGWIDSDYKPRYYARVQPEFIQEHMLRLGLPDIRVYLLLCRMATKYRGIVWPSVRYLAERLGVSERHVRRSTRKLQQEGLIQKGRYYDRERNRQHNVYKIVLLGPGSSWKDATDTEENEEAITF
jgi:predicted transcriptional regulator